MSDAVIMHGVMSGGTAGKAVRRLVERVDRAPAWGSFDVWPEHFGIVRYRLTVYPPGTDLQTRRWLRAHDAWCGGGLLCAIALAILMTSAVAPIVAVAVSAAVYLVGRVVIGRRSADARRNVRRMVAVDFGERATALEIEHCAQVRRAASILVEADRSLRAGLMSPVEHEIVWARIFDDIAPSQPSPLRRFRVRSASPSR